MANKAKDLASGTLSSSISASSTSISVSCGSGSDLALLGVWPTPPFYITVMPANPSASVPNSLDSEIMRVSALNANDGIVNMAVSRGQRGTTAKAFSAGDIVSHAVYAEDAVLLGEEVSPENPSPWVGTDEIEDGAITSNKIADGTIATGDIADGAITTSKVADSNITTAKIADGAITSAKIAADGYRRTQPSGLTDANNLTDTGLYYLTEIWQNAPDPGSQIYQAIVIMAGGTGHRYGHQIFINLWSNATYIRGCYDGAWAEWHQFTVS